MATLVLVPGAGLGAWVWRRVAPALRTAGHDVHALTLTGAGDRAHLARPDIDVTAWVTDVVAHLVTEELDDVVLVGHSFCGTVITGVAERVPQRIARLVFLDAFLLEDGKSAFDAMPSEVAGFIGQVVSEHDGWSLPWFTDEQLAAAFGDHGLSAEDLLWMRRHVSPQPIATYREALPLGNPAAAALPRTYVRCTQQPGPPHVRPGTPGWDWVGLSAGHWPMVSAPRETAELLDAIASGR